MEEKEVLISPCDGKVTVCSDSKGWTFSHQTDTVYSP